MNQDFTNWPNYKGVLNYVYDVLRRPGYVIKIQNFKVTQTHYIVTQMILDGDYLKITDWHGNPFWENYVEWIVVSEEEKKLWEKYPGYLGVGIYPRGFSPLTWREIHLITPQIELYVKPQ
jgi:hypothetical protein